MSDLPLPETLREQVERAVRKMDLMQDEDACSVPHEFETLILTLQDYFTDRPNE